MTERAATYADPLRTSHFSAGPRIVLVADDYKFLQGMRDDDPAHVYAWSVAKSREHFVELSEPPPLAVVIDVESKNIDPIDALYLLSALSLKTKVVLLHGGDSTALAHARETANTASVDVIGTLARPIAMNALARMLSQYSSSAIAVSPEELQSALREQQMLLHFQPIIAHDGNRWLMSDVEALVRWRHPKHGLLFPGQFLGTVRSSGLMSDLTDYVLTEAVQQAGLWRQQRLDLGVMVNLEPHLVRDLDFAERLVRILGQHDVPPERLTLEVVESSSARDRELVVNAMQSVRDSGIRLSLDDFGTGSSSLTELRRLPFTDIKIDRALVHDMTVSPKAATIVNGIVDLAHRLSIRVCAEGVETAETFAELVEAKCDAIQGVFIARPMTAANVERLVRNWSPDQIGTASPGSGLSTTGIRKY
jgi:EAL domain-containing protein (putative c-di-GMP-specific phosphodiesterase class I)